MLLHRRVSLLSRYYRLKCHPPRVNFSLNGKDNKEKSTTPVTTPVTTPIKTNESSTFSLKAVSDTCKSIAVSTVDMIKDPAGTWKLVKDTANHYWMGTKLLCTEIKMARQILGRVLQGSSMTRRERMQLIRTTMDIFRLVPFAVFVIVPFMEFLLPFALKLFPNMLPSTFQDELKKEENMKQELQMRLAVAGFLQETLQEMAARSSKASEAQDLVKFIQKARKGESLPNESVIKIASLFKDELTLANIPRPQLVSMCQFMGINPYGGDNFLRFQLRSKFRMIKDDDKRILWEGIEGLNLQELRDACQVRGMRAHGLSRARYMKQLKEWIDLSIQKSIPISLLIMSRAFVITSSDQQAEDILMSSISSLDSDTINEVVLAAASPAEENTVDIRKRKLESLQFQKEMIAEELEEVQEAKTKTMDKQKAISNESTLKAQDSTKILTESKVSEPKDLEESKFVTTTKDERSVKELTVAELEAIGDLTRLSAVSDFPAIIFVFPFLSHATLSLIGSTRKS